MWGFETRQRGYGLLELVVSIVVAGLMFAGFVTVYGTVMRHGADPELQVKALAAADAYLNEILSRAYRDPDDGALCGAAEASRPLFDDVCDYRNLTGNGCTAASSACPLGACPCDGSGLPADGLAELAVAVDVSPATWSGVAGLAVRVDVSGPAGVTATLHAFRAED